MAEELFGAHYQPCSKDPPNVVWTEKAMIGNEEVRAVPYARAILSPGGEPHEVNRVVTVPSDDAHWPAQPGEPAGGSLR
jgi:hypothetical protein